MPSSVDPLSDLGKKAHVSKRIERITEFMPMSDAIRRKTLPAYSTQSDSLPATLFQNSQKTRFILEAGCAHKIREMTLKVTVNVTGGDCRLAPLPLWFDRIEWRTSGGSDLVDTTYGDVMLSKFLAIDKQKLPEVLRGINLSPNWKPLAAYASGTTHTFYMPLVCSWIDIANIHWQHIRGDMHIEFHLQPA